MQGLIDALSAYRDSGLEVDVITTRPNRYASFKNEAPAEENHGWLRIYRVDLPAHNSGMLDQAKAYSSYVRGVRRLTSGKSWDLVFATSSRLMTAGLGTHIARRIKAPLYLDIRDLFTDNMEELLVSRPARLLLPAFRRIENTAYRNAARINIVSAGFLPHVKSISPRSNPRVYTNGIDDIFLSHSFLPLEAASNLPLIVYAGNMGEGQGLHRIIPEAARLLNGRARIRLIGDGGRRKDLEVALRKTGARNVEVLSPVPREKLLEHYREADLLFLHLNDLNAFRKVLPSKIFEYAATGKPILAGVSGYAAQFLTAEVPSSEVFAPLDAVAMANAANRLIDGPRFVDRESFRSNFARRNIMQEMASDIISAIKECA